MYYKSALKNYSYTPYISKNLEEVTKKKTS